MTAVAATQVQLTNLEALRIEANIQIDQAIEAGNAHVWQNGAWVENSEEGIRLSRAGENFLSVAVGYDEYSAAGKLLDLTVEVQYVGKEVDIFEQRRDPETSEAGTKNVKRKKHEEVAGTILKLLTLVG